MDSKLPLMIKQQELTFQEPMTVLVGSGRNFKGFSEPLQKSLMINAWTQTTGNDFSFLNYIEHKEQKSKREIELEEKIKILQENLRAHSDLLSQICVTSAKTTALLEKSYSFQQNEQQSTATSITSQMSIQGVSNIKNNESSPIKSIINPLQQGCSTPITSQMSTQGVSNIKNNENSPIKSIINPLQQGCSSPPESFKYTIVAEGSGYNNGEPIEIQLAEEDGALNLNSSAESGRLQICIDSDENININREVNSNSETKKQALPTTSPLNEHNYNENQKIAMDQRDNNASYYHSDQGFISPTYEENKKKRRSNNGVRKTPQNKGKIGKKQANISPQKPNGYDSDNVMICIGPNNTRISASDYHKTKWHSASAATRDLLMAVFGRETLAKHSLTGKPSPAFKHLNRPVKQQLDPVVIDDVIFAVTHKCKVSKKEVRNTITTKCADETKMWMAKMEKALKEKNKENVPE